MTIKPIPASEQDRIAVSYYMWLLEDSSRHRSREIDHRHPTYFMPPGARIAWIERDKMRIKRARKGQ